MEEEGRGRGGGGEGEGWRVGCMGKRVEREGRGWMVGELKITEKIGCCRRVPPVTLNAE